MNLINGDRMVTAQLYDDQCEEFLNKKMSIIDFLNTYTDEGVNTEETKENYIEYLITAARNISKHCYNTMCEDCSFFYYNKQHCKLHFPPQDWEV